MKWFNFFLTFSHKPFDFEWLHNLKRKRHFSLCQALFTHANMNELLNKNFKRMEAWCAAMQFWSRESTSKWFTLRHLGTKCEVGWVLGWLKSWCFHNMKLMKIFSIMAILSLDHDWCYDTSRNDLKSSWCHKRTLWKFMTIDIGLLSHVSLSKDHQWFS